LERREASILLVSREASAGCDASSFAPAGRGAQIGSGAMSPFGKKQTFGCERRDLILTLGYVRSKPTVGVVKSLALIGAGPVGLLHTQNLGNK
jgi:hypothetical protein